MKNLVITTIGLHSVLIYFYKNRADTHLYILNISLYNINIIENCFYNYHLRLLYSVIHYIDKYILYKIVL